MGGRGGKVKFCGGCWAVSVHPASAVSHLLTLSAHCHSNGARASGDGPKALGETPVPPGCAGTRTGAMPRMQMYTYSTNAVKRPFQWQIAKQLIKNKEQSDSKATTRVQLPNLQRSWSAQTSKKRLKPHFVEMA